MSIDVKDLENLSMKELFGQSLNILDDKEMDKIEKVDSLVKYAAVMNNKAAGKIKEGEKGYDELCKLSYCLSKLEDFKQINDLVLKAKDKVALNNLMTNYRACVYFYTLFLESIEERIHEFVQ